MAVKKYDIDLGKEVKELQAEAVKIAKGEACAYLWKDAKQVKVFMVFGRLWNNRIGVAEQVRRKFICMKCKRCKYKKRPERWFIT